MVQYCFIYFPERLLATGVLPGWHEGSPCASAAACVRTPLKKQHCASKNIVLLFPISQALKHLSFRKGMRTCFTHTHAHTHGYISLTSILFTMSSAYAMFAGRIQATTSTRNKCPAHNICDKFCLGYLYKYPTSTRRRCARHNIHDNFWPGYL